MWNAISIVKFIFAFSAVASANGFDQEIGMDSDCFEGLSGSKASDYIRLVREGSPQGTEQVLAVLVIHGKSGKIQAVMAEMAQAEKVKSSNPIISGDPVKSFLDLTDKYLASGHISLDSVRAVVETRGLSIPRGGLAESEELQPLTGRAAFEFQELFKWHGLELHMRRKEVKDKLAAKLPRVASAGLATPKSAAYIRAIRKATFEGDEDIYLIMQEPKPWTTRGIDPELADKIEELAADPEVIAQWSNIQTVLFEIHKSAPSPGTQHDGDPVRKYVKYMTNALAWKDISPREFQKVVRSPLEPVHPELRRGRVKAEFKELFEKHTLELRMRWSDVLEGISKIPPKPQSVD